MTKGSASKNSVMNPRQDLYEIYAHPEYSLKKKKKIIDSLDDLDGFELAFVIGYILNIQLTGHLNIISSDDEVTGISVHQGVITYIDFPDKQTYFGELLLQHGYVTKKELDTALKSTEMHVGQYLLKMGQITRQQIDFTFRHQMELRLSKLICDKTFNVNFSEATETSIYIKMTALDFYNLCYTWLESHFQTGWLKDHFSHWENRTVLFVEGSAHESDFLKRPDFVELPDFLNQLKLKKSFAQLQELYHSKEAPFYRAMYLLGLMGIIIFQKDGEIQHKSKLEEMFQQLSGKTGIKLHQALADLTGVPAANAEAIYLAYSKLISENADDGPPDVKTQLVKIGIDFLSSGEQFAKVKMTSKSQIELSILQNALQSVQTDLLHGKFFEAFGKLKKISIEATAVPSLKLYLIWAKLGHAMATGLKVDVPTYEMQLESLSAEDKESAEYYYVRAMYFELKGDQRSSQIYFQKAVSRKSMFAAFPIGQGYFKKILKFMGIKK
ncbi:MAG: hypothetical protein A2622_13310 [Bdellovibrionales bacterium RIFCSPHIGHO2_01_FULL_40_29]|nr:MAG: hypothetical protein A2622_13310 [Bdellovibrionales bacterium RIFCSPHIGHO2_01_FULL_40_29]OFZ33334.1 MAG: hypothetical protein A3D17_13575 [Bdellovibrionales bacterium RIFCSPHIGHO2_02_FULL_40_15]